MYQRIPVSAARNSFSDLVSRAVYADEATILTRRGKDVAAVLPISSVNMKKLGSEKKSVTTATSGKKLKSGPA